MYIQNLEEIKAKIQIESVFQHFSLPIKNKTLCPFHQEKTPSFSISPKHNKATCFGSCGRSWSPIDFIMEYEQLDFIPAVELAAKLENVPIQYAQNMSEEEIAAAKSQLEKRQKAYHYNRLIWDKYFQYFHRNLEQLQPSELSTIQLANRSLSLETIKHFGICETPNQHNFIVQFAKSLKLDLDLIMELGWIGQKGAHYYDKLSNRLLFPILTKNQTIAGFTARSLTEKQAAKYLNSPEHIVYQKSQLWYGLTENRKAIRARSKVFIVEGTFDLLTLYNYGIQNVISSCGTSISQHQAKQLIKTVKEVVLLYDGDEAGIKAMQRNIPTLLAAGLRTSVVQMPEGEDPDSYIRKVGLEAFQNYLNTQEKEAINWTLDQIISRKGDPYQIETATFKAVELLNLIESDIIQDAMILELAKNFKLDKKKLKQILKEQLDQSEIIEEDAHFLNEEQRTDLLKYGIYQAKNAYYTNSSGEKSRQLSNFIIKPLFHVKSKENPKRLFELVNIHGDRAVLDIDTADFVSSDRFIVKAEAEGNFVFRGNNKDFLKLKMKVYDEMDSCYEIDTLGQHHEGFYAFGNGLYQHGQFHPTDQFGMVGLVDKHYFLPAFSEIYSKEGDKFVDDKKFRYLPSNISFEQWAKLFCQVHGDNGKIAMLFYIAALYRDVIYGHLKFFPHLNFFGQPGTGKSYLAWGLSSMFGEAIAPFNLNSGTQVGFFNRFELAKNNIVWFDEYKNNIDHRRVEFLKGAYDGVGREKGQKSSKRSIKTLVYSACIISGQELPTHDNALFTRVITLEFSQSSRTQEEKDLALQLEQLQKSFELGSITAKLTDFRPNIMQDFNLSFEATAKALRTQLKSNVFVKDRILSNMATLLTVYRILSPYLNFPFSEEEFFELAKDKIIRQSELVSSADEVTTFWEMFDFMAANHQIQERSDYVIELTDHLKVVQSGKQVTTKIFNESKRVLFITFTKVHPFYLDAHRKQFNKLGLQKNSLQHYLKNHPSFLGAIKSKRIGEKNTYCYAFDYDMLNLNIKDVKAELDSDDQKFFEKIAE